MQLSHPKNRAFTMVEVLVTVVIVGIVASLAVGAYYYMVPASELRKAEADAKTLNEAVDVYRLAGGSIAGLSAVEVVQKLKAAPDTMLKRQTLALRTMLDPRTSLRAYSTEDARPRLLYASGRFSAATAGSGYLVEYSGSSSGPESRTVRGSRFAATDAWVWDYNAPAAAGGAGPPPTVTLTTDAPVGGPTGYLVTAPGTYTFTATTPDVSGNLTLNVGPHTQTIAVGGGSQTTSRQVTFGPGANFTLTAFAAIMNDNGSDNESLTVTVNIPGTPTATPAALVITGPDTVVVRASDGTLTVPYTWTLTYSDGSIVSGRLTDSAQEQFPWVAGGGTAVRNLTETQSGYTATKKVNIEYVPAYTVSIDVSPAGAGVAAVSNPLSGGPYDEGMPVSVTASPASAAWLFSGWTGVYSSTDNPLSFNISANTTLTANFVAVADSLVLNMQETLNVGVGATETASGTYDAIISGVISSGPVTQAFTWTAAKAGTTVIETVSYTLGALTATDTVAVTYAAIPTHALTVELSDAAAGTANGSVAAAAEGSANPVSVTLNAGWSITSVSVTGSGAAITGGATDNARTLTMGTGDVVVRYNVTYTPPTHLLTVLNDGNGSAAGGGSIASGTLAPITATPNSGYAFDRWTGDSVTDQFSSSTTILMDAPKTVTATFRTMTASGTWTIRAAGGAGPVYQITVTMTRDSDGTVIHSYSGPTNGSNEYTFSAVAIPIGNYTITATITSDASGGVAGPTQVAHVNVTP